MRLDILEAWMGAFAGIDNCYSETALTMAATIERLCATEHNRQSCENGGYYDEQDVDIVWDEIVEWQRS